MDTSKDSTKAAFGNAFRSLRVQVLGTLPLILALGLLLAYAGPTEVSFVGTPPVVDESAQQMEWTRAIVDAQVAELGCDKVQRLSGRVAVTPYPVEGEHVFDTAVVSVVSFDEAWAQAKAGRVVVQGWCGA